MRINSLKFRSSENRLQIQFFRVKKFVTGCLQKFIFSILWLFYDFFLDSPKSKMLTRKKTFFTLVCQTNWKKFDDFLKSFYDHLWHFMTSIAIDDILWRFYDFYDSYTPCSNIDNNFLKSKNYTSKDGKLTTKSSLKVWFRTFSKFKTQQPIS